MQLMRTAMLLLLVLFVVPCVLSLAAEEVTAERLGQFYPQSWEQRILGKTAYSHLVIPGHQKASTTNYYDFGGVEIIYYAKEDAVFEKKVKGIRAPASKIHKLEIDGCPVIALDKRKIMADIGGEIFLSIDCSNCKSQEELLKMLRAFDLNEMKNILQ